MMHLTDLRERMMHSTDLRERMMRSADMREHMVRSVEPRKCCIPLVDALPGKGPTRRWADRLTDC